MTEGISIDTKDMSKKLEALLYGMTCSIIE